MTIEPTGATILVVDDDASTIDLVLKTLGDYDLIPATSGSDALRILDAQTVDRDLGAGQRRIVALDHQGAEVLARGGENRPGSGRDPGLPGSEIRVSRGGLSGPRTG